VSVNLQEITNPLQFHEKKKKGDENIKKKMVELWSKIVKWHDGFSI
jgi:hypothetical protein